MKSEITNGVVKIGRTIKTGDFESKRGDVELSFNIPEGEFHDEHTDNAIRFAHIALTKLLDHSLANTRNDAKPKEAIAPVKPPKAPKAAEAKASVEPAKVAEKPAADPSDMEDLDRAVPPLLKKEIEAQNAAAKVDETDISSLMGGDEPAKEITDKQLQDAAQECMNKNRNAPAIHKVLRDLGIKSPPGRIIDLPQEKRQAYLDELLKIKPLA